MNVTKKHTKIDPFFLNTCTLLCGLSYLITSCSNFCGIENHDHQVFGNCHLHCRHRCASQPLNSISSPICDSCVLVQSWATTTFLPQEACVKAVFGGKHGILVGVVGTEGVCELWPPHTSIYVKSSLFNIQNSLPSICGGKLYLFLFFFFKFSFKSFTTGYKQGKLFYLLSFHQEKINFLTSFM